MKQRFAKGLQRNITDFFKAWITADSIKIFSITFCVLVIVYCTYKRFQNCAICYNLLLEALHSSSFRVKTVICLRLNLICSWDLQYCMLLKDSFFVLWINKFKCSLKTSVSLLLATERLKRGRIVLTSSIWAPLIWTLWYVPSVSVLERSDCILIRQQLWKLILSSNEG